MQTVALGTAPGSLLPFAPAQPAAPGFAPLLGVDPGVAAPLLPPGGAQATPTLLPGGGQNIAATALIQSGGKAGAPLSPGAEGAMQPEESAKTGRGAIAQLLASTALPRSNEPAAAAERAGPPVLPPSAPMNGSEADVPALPTPSLGEAVSGPDSNAVPDIETPEASTSDTAIIVPTAPAPPASAAATPAPALPISSEGKAKEIPVALATIEPVMPQPGAAAKPFKPAASSKMPTPPSTDPGVDADPELAAPEAAPPVDRAAQPLAAQVPLGNSEAAPPRALPTGDGAAAAAREAAPTGPTPANASSGDAATDARSARVTATDRASEAPASARLNDASFAEAMRASDGGTQEQARPQATASAATHVTAPTATDPARAVPAAYRQADPAAPTRQHETNVDTRAGALGRNLGVEIARHVRDGDETMRVRLNPVELGKVDVTLSFDDAGALRATMRAETPAALELLRRDAAELGRALDQAGVRSDAQSFRFEQRSDGQANGQPGQQQGRHDPSGRGAAPRDGDAPAPAELPYRTLRGSGRVDLLA